MKDELVIRPEKALDPDIAYKVLSLWLVGGYSSNNKRMLNYTLGDKPDYKGARRLVNDVDQAALIAGYAVSLET